MFFQNQETKPGNICEAEKNGFQQLKPDYFTRNMRDCRTEGLVNSEERYFDFEFFSNKCNAHLIGNTSYFYTESIAFWNIKKIRINIITEVGLSFNLGFSQQI